ncbi:MAG TPA: alpha/beta hydrolase [Propionibacteriaceae bacterium]|nr:alpha/beta hydrolase [Propionibacteriaceae bacterium]
MRATRLLAALMALALVLAMLGFVLEPLQRALRPTPQTTRTTAPARPTSSAIPSTTPVTERGIAAYDPAAHTLWPSAGSPDRRSLPVGSERPPGFVAPPDGQGVQRYVEQSITWRECGGHLCGTLAVPLDWDDPDGEAITLALRMAPASGTRTGVLFVNPGGPGGSGQDMVANFDASEFPGYDVVGWDPRGSGESTPPVCGTDDETDALNVLDQSPDDASEWAALVEGWEQFSTSCRERSGPLLDHISTIDNARDLDLLRALFRVPKLDYFGISYGTFVGATYAELYPDKVGRMVLDSAVDIVENDDVTQAAGFDRALGDFATWCVGARCGLGADSDEVLATIVDAINGMDSSPLRVGDRTLTQSLAITGVAAFLYGGSEGYRMLATSLQTMVKGNGAYILNASDVMLDRARNGDYGQMAFSFPAIRCLDEDDRGVAAAKSSWPGPIRRAPIFGALAGPDVTCTVWSAQPADQLKLTAAGAPPIVVLGVTGDPATPYENAVGMAEALESGVLVSWKGAGHSAWERGNSCVRRAVTDYLNDGVVPADQTKC